MKQRKYYVVMTDKFMSGWGMAKDKINKLVIECDSWDDALTVKANAKDRAEMKYINIRQAKPYYQSNNYLVSYGSKLDYSTWFKKDRPFKRS